MRASDAERDHVAGLLGTAFTEGRLSQDEYDDRLASAYSARTYGDLDSLLRDLPAPGPGAPPLPMAPLPVVPAPGRINGAAQASVAFGIAEFAFGPFGTIPAIVLGHVALQQIRRTGQQGKGLAVAGLVLGYGAVAFFIAVVVVLLTLPGAPPVPSP
jgi:hypothetical protein